MIFALVQLAILIFLMIFLPLTFSQNRREQIKFKNAISVLEVLAMVLLALCFINYDISSFQDEKYFSVFAVCTLFSVIGFWTNKLTPHSNKWIKSLALMLTGTLFWLCFFTAIKFVPYLPFVWFPLLGLYALAPIIIGVITLSEIRYHSAHSPRFSMPQIMGLGLIPLVTLQILMNLITPHTWEFVKIFTPSNQFF